MQYFVIGSEDVVLGFHMVGVQGEMADDAKSAKENFLYALGNKEIGVIIIEEAIANLIREDVDEYIFSHEFPLICEIPGVDGRDASRPSLRDLAVAAMGIKL
jgi:vacuolar-type H+-ATPase subunit F/Vma7